MDSQRRHGVRWAARAGILALALNALVPIHLAFDLGEALTPAHRAGTAPERHGIEWRVLALMIGHGEHDADDDTDRGHPHGATCPVIAAFAALTGLITATVPTLAQPTAVAVAELSTPAIDQPAIVAATAYRSRAPPRA